MNTPIRYQDQTFAVDYTPELRQMLLATPAAAAPVASAVAVPSA